VGFRIWQMLRDDGTYTQFAVVEPDPTKSPPHKRRRKEPAQRRGRGGRSNGGGSSGEKRDGSGAQDEGKGAPSHPLKT